MAALSFQTVPGGEQPGRFADVRRVAETGSTNADVLALARADAAEGVVVVAGHQREGRGRRGRTWTSPPGSGLLVSVLLRPPLPPRAAHLVTVAAALAAADACFEVAGVEPALKWPNDLLVEPGTGTAKLAGLLAESLVEGERLVGVVVGMGLNLSRTPAIAEAPRCSATTLHNPSTGAVAPGSSAYLEDLAGRGVDRDELLASWLHHLEGRYPSPSCSAALLDHYRRRCSTLGRTVRVELAGEAFEGIAEDVNEDGHLLVGTAAGQREVAVADVHHLRVKGRDPVPPVP